MPTRPPRPEFEKRKYLRLQSIKSGILSFSQDLDNEPARIVDMSSAGARLELTNAIKAPGRFSLTIHPDDAVARKTVNCQLQWQRGHSLGVTFV